MNDSNGSLPAKTGRSIYSKGNCQSGFVIMKIESMYCYENNGEGMRLEVLDFIFDILYCFGCLTLVKSR